MDIDEGRVQEEVMIELTLFSIPRGFKEPYIIEQENALGSWVRLEPCPEIILFGDEPGIEEAAKKFGCRYAPEVERSESGRPIVGGVFHRAQNMATHDILCYANMDILLMQDWMDALEQCMARFDEFLMIGQRWALTIGGLLNFSDGWQGQLYERIKRGDGRLCPGHAIDFFAFTRGLFPKFPPFIVGKCAWDNWLVSNAIGRGIPTINVTPVTTIIHQGESPRTLRDAEWSHNQMLYKTRKYKSVAGNTEKAPWVLTKEGFKKR